VVHRQVVAEFERLISGSRVNARIRGFVDDLKAGGSQYSYLKEWDGTRSKRLRAAKSSQHAIADQLGHARIVLLTQPE
jgi:hypothetical protein